MKRILTLITVFALVLTACEGDQGPPGFDGLDGEIIVSSAFEIEVDFNANTNYAVRENYGFDVLPSDVTLVYIEWNTTPNGQPVWRLVPQTVIFDDGNDLVYNFQFTQTYVEFFLEGSNLGILDPIWTQNQVFRVVVVPADNIGGIDLTNLDTLLNLSNIETFELR